MSLSQYFEASVELHYTRFHDLKHKTLAFHNDRLSTLYRVAQAFHSAWTEAKRIMPEKTYPQLQKEALKLISTRITGGRYIRHRGFNKQGDVYVMVNDKRVRVDYHEIDMIARSMLIDEETIYSPRKSDFAPVSAYGFQFHIGGNIVTFDAATLTVKFTPVIDTRWSKSRSTHSVNGKFIMREIERFEWFGSQRATQKIVTTGKDGNSTFVIKRFEGKVPMLAETKAA